MKSCSLSGTMRPILILRVPAQGHGPRGGVASGCAGGVAPDAKATEAQPTRVVARDAKANEAQKVGDPVRSGLEMMSEEL